MWGPFSPLYSVLLLVCLTHEAASVPARCSQVIEILEGNQLQWNGVVDERAFIGIAMYWEVGQKGDMWP